MALVHNLKVEDSILISSYPDKVFTYLTEADKLAQWWPKSAESEPRKNGKLTFNWANNTSLDTEFYTFLSPRQVSFQFGKEFVELKLKEKRGDTIVTVTHSNIVFDDSDFSLLIHIAQSWSFLLSNLKTVIEYNIDLR